MSKHEEKYTTSSQLLFVFFLFFLSYKWSNFWDQSLPQTEVVLNTTATLYYSYNTGK